MLLLSVLWTPQASAVKMHATKAEPLDVMPVVVYGVTQDQQDFFWLAGEYDGLLRFDGQHYLRFDTATLPRHVSYSQVVVDQQNQLWVATWGHGLWRLDQQRKDWQPVSALPANARIQTLLLARDQTLWIGTTSGLYFLPAGQLQAQAWQPLHQQRIWQLAEQDKNNLWVATSNGLYQLTPDSPAESRWVEQTQLHQQEIRALAVHGQQLLIGLRAQLHLLNLTNMQVTHSVALGNPNTILPQSQNSWLVGSIDGMFSVRQDAGELQLDLLQPAVDVRKIYRDRRGKIWLASRNYGFTALTPAPLRAVTQGLEQFVAADRPHRLGPASLTNYRWQALENSLLQLKDGQWREIKFQSDTPVAYVRDVVQFGAHTLAATDQGLFYQQGESVFSKVPLQSTHTRLNIERMAIAPDGALWLGLWEQGVLRLPAGMAEMPLREWNPVQMQTDLQPQEGIIDIQTDAQQRLWLLSRQGRLYLGNSDSLTLQWQADPALTSGYFQCMLPVQDSIWLCSDRGLIRLRQNVPGGKLLTGELFNRTSGLPDQRVIGIARTEHYLWVLTRNGLAQMTVDGKQIHLLEPRTGLELSQAQLHGLTALPNDQVQLATSSGLWLISPKDMTAVPADMQLHLSTIRLNQQLLTLADDHDVLVLPEQINELQLKFKLLSYQPHLEVRYFFRWQHQSGWTALGQDGTLNLTQLSPGQHQLDVMARAGGQQIYASPLRLQVPVPFWLQPVGISLLSLTTALLLWLLYHYRTKQLAQRAARLDMLVAQRTAELEHANQQLLLQSNTDSLTGLLNRRALYAASELLQAQRHRKPAELTLVLMDIDHFKRINDQHGHDIGDAVLCQVAAYLKQRLRRQDLIARWGGEEFLLLMPDTAVAPASQLIEELRQGICRLQVPGLQQTLTATFGISAVTLQQNALDQAVKAADQALYQGKAQGRDQVVTASTTS